MNRVSMLAGLVVCIVGGFFAGACLGSMLVHVVGDTPGFDSTILLEQLRILAAQFGPWGLLVAAGIGVWLRFRRSSPANPSPSVPPGPPPATPEPLPQLPGLTGRPILDWLIKILTRTATAKYPDMKPDEALERHIVEQANMGYYHADQARKESSLR